MAADAVAPTVLAISSPAPKADPRIGIELAGRYRTQKKLGEGGMGHVYLAEDTLFGTSVVVKFMTRQAEESGMKERFFAEAKSAARVHHPNVVSIYHYGETGNGELYVIMEYVQGQDLTTIMSAFDKEMPIETALNIVEQLVFALGAAHDKGIVHRDLKPSNIMLPSFTGYPYFVKLIDFGIAKVMEKMSAEKTHTGVIMGSPGYISPEQSYDASSVDSRTDIYSLGVILYEMTTGTSPFNINDTVALIDAHRKLMPESARQRAPSKGIPPELDELIMRCLAKKRDDRPRSMSAILLAIGEIRRSLLIAPPPPPAPPPEPVPLVHKVAETPAAVPEGITFSDLVAAPGYEDSVIIVDEQPVIEELQPLLEPDLPLHLEPILVPEPPPRRRTTPVPIYTETFWQRHPLLPHVIVVGIVLAIAAYLFRPQLDSIIERLFPTPTNPTPVHPDVRPVRPRGHSPSGTTTTNG